MKTYFNYLEEVKNDVMEYIKNDYTNYDFTDIEYNRQEVEEDLNDVLWTNDSVTGNGSGSYTFNSYEAMENVFADIDTVQEALRYFCVDADTIADKFLNEEFEWFDVTARCYVLGQAISEALDEVIEELENEE